MALILYPLENWDSFASVAAADIIIGGFVTSDGQTAYLALDESGKEAILRQTALQIKLCPNIVLPATLENDLEVAQCYLTIHALTVDMLSFDSNDKAITGERVDTLGVTYAVSKKGSNSDFDTMTSMLLKQYGCSGQSSGFSQVSLGRS